MRLSVRARGFESHLLRQIGTSVACSDFLFYKNQSPVSLFLLFRKKSRSAHLLFCKRSRCDSPSIPTFYEFTYGANADNKIITPSHHLNTRVYCRDLRMLNYSDMSSFSFSPPTQSFVLSCLYEKCEI